jgi:hypothetical protein
MDDIPSWHIVGDSLRFERTAGDDAFSHRWHRRFAGDQKQRPSPVAIAIKIRKFVALAGRAPGRRWLVRRHRARLDTGEVGGVMGEIARRPEFAVADAVDAGLDLFLDRLGDGRRDLGGDHHRVGDFRAR